MLPSVVPRLATDSAVRVFTGVWKLLSFLRLPSQDGSPSLPVLSLFLSFIFFSTSFWRQWAAFLGAWCPLLAFRSCFVEFTQHSNVLLMNLWGKSGLPFLFLHHLRTTFSLFLIEYLVWRSEFILFLAMNYTFVQLIIFKKPLWNSYGWSDKTS